MKIEKIDNHVESLLLTGMIVSTRFLRAVQDIYHPNLIEASFVRTGAKWCMDYFKRYKKAPRIHIQDIYNSHRRNGLDPDQAELLKEYLESISQEFSRAKKFNVDYLLEKVEVRFKEQSLKNLAEDIKALVAEGKTQDAELLQLGYKQIQRPTSQGVEPLVDRNAIYEAFASKEGYALFTPPGDLGKFLGSIERQSFIAIEGVEKRGKTWWLMQFAIWALQAGCNVAFFECGDMSQRDLIRRLMCNITRMSDRHEGKLLIPVLDCRYNQDNSCSLKQRACSFGCLNGEEKLSFAEAKGYVPCTTCKKTSDEKRFRGAVWYKWEHVDRLDWRTAEEAGKKFSTRFGGRRLMLSTHPTRTINLQGIETQLDIWERTKNFIADFVVVDYADILDKEDRRTTDARMIENDRWAAARTLSQKRNIGFLWGTQANADAYTKALVSETNTSEDKRKNAHITMKITLNQLPEEKEAGIMRVGKLFVRNDRFDRRRTCTVLQCLDLGRPYLSSFLS